MRSPQVMRLAALCGRGLVRGLLASCRLKIEGLEAFLEIAHKQPCILVSWHCHLAIIADILGRNAPTLSYATFVSNSRDGEPLAQLTLSYPNTQVIRVPHNARHMALKEAIEFLNAPGRVLVLTPDGPRGPARQAKPGAALAAQQAETPLVPFSWTASRCWQFKTWDRLQLPKPFSKVDVTFGAPFVVDPAASLQQQSDLVSEQLNRLIPELDLRSKTSHQT